MAMEYEHLQTLLPSCIDSQGTKAFFEALGYNTIDPLLLILEELPASAKQVVKSIEKIVHIGNGAPFEVLFVRLQEPKFKRTDIRRFLEAYYRHYPQGERLFIFAPSEQTNEIMFVSPKRLVAPRDPYKVRLWLRILQTRLDHPYRTDMDVLLHIQAHGIQDPEQIWRLHEQAFSVQRVTEQFFSDYSKVFDEIQNFLLKSHKDLGKAWARDYTHMLLNRIMFIYFIARKGWLLGEQGNPDRDFMCNFWRAYKETNGKNAFHQEWLDVLFFESFNRRFQNRAEYQSRFPQYLINALVQAPYLNGGLYTRRQNLDDRLNTPIPDDLFALLFEKWFDGTTPGLFERYNFTVIESGRFDQEVAVDPEMLGAVYEQLVNQTFEEESEGDLRRSAGIFYTARTEIDLMCRLSVAEYLKNHLDPSHFELVYRFVFAVSEEEKQDAEKALIRENLVEEVSNLLKRMRVCDPACGSGSFLVGMLLVLDDLMARLDRILGNDDTSYKRRKRILQDQLYGVDVMEWAVRVAELRLWLQLVVETELRLAERFLEPLLPNLNLKLRSGDSLLQTIGDFDLSPFRRHELSIPPHLKGRLTQLKGKKRRFFQGEDPTISDEMLKKEEFDLFRDILLNSILDTEKALHQKREELKSQPTQGSLEGIPAASKDSNLKERLQREVLDLEERLERLRKAQEALSPGTQPPFVWDMAFLEVFEDEDPGFDIVIGNPPYVRQEKIKDYLGRFDRNEYIRRLNESLRAIYPNFFGKSRTIVGRADYYVYFYLHALSLLSEKGVFCFITSNSWLDVAFGKDLQEFFLRLGDLRMVIDNRKKRSFAQADINTVIVLAGAPRRKGFLTEDEMKSRKVRFVAFQVPFEEAISPVIFSEIFEDNLYEEVASIKVLRRHEFRAILSDQFSLYKEGLTDLADVDEGEKVSSSKGANDRKKQGNKPLFGVHSCVYAGNKWGGKYLRAPDIFYTILEKGKGKLVRLGDIAQVRFGIKTGANEFFYLEPTGKPAPKGFLHVRNSAGWEGEIEEEFLKPVIKSPRECRTIRIAPDRLPLRLFMCHETREKLQGTAALEYLAYGESKRYHERPTCRSRERWWDVGKRLPPHGIVPCSFREHFIAYSNCGVFADKRLYDLTSAQAELLLMQLNGTVFVLFLEMQTRSYGGGGGPIDATVYEIASLHVLDPHCFAARDIGRLEESFARLCERRIGTLFDEVEQPDRRALDNVIFDVLGLTQGERDAVYEAVVELVRQRLEKARSV